jgi:DNA polymerase I-like protein with 3'-5' exonuclease and polymerase domains
MSVMPTFIRASKMGLRCDVPKLRSLAAERLAKADEIEKEIESIIGRSFNPRSPQQTAEIVFDHLGFGKRYKKRTTQKDYLMDIAASEKDGDKKTVLTKIIRARENRNIVSRYLTEASVVDRDGRIRTNWRLNGTRNGRFSATKPWWPGLPLQTVPNDARVIFIPDPGHTFIGWDYEQAEARYVAVKTRDWDLLDDMQEGIDIHTKLASQLPFGFTYEELMSMITEKGKDNVEERFLAKTCRHAMNYYLSHVGLKRTVNEKYLDTGVGIDARDAKILHAAYLELHPGLTAWWDEVYRKMLAQGSLTNAWGRKRNILGRIYKFEHGHRDGIAFEPQSSISDLTTLSIADMDKALDFGEKGQILTHMHDGALIQVKEEDKERTIELIREHATKEMVVDGQLLTVPLEIKVGYNWKDMKSV